MLSSDVEKVRDNCPNLFEYISQTQENPDWESISYDLQQINWLQEDSMMQQQILASVFDLADSNALQQLENGQQKFNILSLNRVKIFLNNIAYGLSCNRDKIQMACYQLRKKLQDVFFFKQAKLKLQEADQDKIVETFFQINVVYQELKKQLTQCLTHIDKSFKIELGKSLKTTLDQCFNDNVILNKKQMLKNDSNARQIIDEIDQEIFSSTRQFGGSMQYGPVGSYNNMYSSNRENNYLGELDDNGIRQGYGQITYFNGDSYEGNWVNDKLGGIGIYRWRDGGWYEGEFHEGKMHGNGVRVYSTGNVYTGDFVKGRKEGQGKMVFKNGDEYQGEWVNDEMHGQGTYTWASQDQFIGKFERDKREGKGVLTMVSGEVFEGNWIDNRMVNQGEFSQQSESTDATARIG